MILMRMPSYLVGCTAHACSRPAAFKIAAQWSDGETQELKTYALTCAACTGTEYHRAIQKSTTCRLATGETLDRPGIYELQPGDRDHQLKRRPDLETLP